jgi:Domain of unknown function (DUF4157)
VHDHELTQQTGGRPVKSQEKAAANIASQIGNAGIARLVQGEGIDQSGGGPGRLDREIARAIDEQRGRGRELDTEARATLESGLGEDFSDVRIHDDAEAHELSRAVSAEAFTTGSDVFFQTGKYDPASSAGQKLLAHELTHVAQQRGARPTSDMTVSDPGDASEVEATAVAERVSSTQSSASLTSATVSREAEEEELQTSRVERQAADEEESLPG